MNEKDTYVACFNCDAIGKVEYFTGLSDSMVTVYYCANCWEDMVMAVRIIEESRKNGEDDDDDIPF